MKKVLTILSLFFATTFMVAPAVHAEEDSFNKRAVAVLQEPVNNYNYMCDRCYIDFEGGAGNLDSSAAITLPDESTVYTDVRTMHDIGVEIANAGYFKKVQALGDDFAESQKGKRLQVEIMQLLISKIRNRQLSQQLSVR